MSDKDYLFLVFAVVVVTVGVTWHRRNVLAAGRNWKKVADRFKGSFSRKHRGWIREPHFEVKCTVSGVPLHLFYFIQSTGRSNTYWTRITTPCDPDLEFSIYQEGVFQKIGKGLGFQDVQLEDDEYDAAFIIKSAVPGEMQRLADKEFRRAHLRQPAVKVSAEGGLLGITRRGLVSDLEATQALLEFAAVTARSFLVPRS